MRKLQSPTQYIQFPCLNLKMEICRACLLTQQDMVALDEFCVTSYNLLTNLQINLGDKMPQYFCQNCYNMLKVFTDFREKAIMSETSLKQITENKKPDSLIDDDNKYTEIKNSIKTEICHAGDDRTECETFDDALFSAEVVHDNESLENDLDMKYQLLQCGLCKGEFIDNMAFLDHLKQHKRGGKCKLCFEKVKITDVYAHTLAHLQSLANLDHDSGSKLEIKLEPTDSDYFAPSTALKVEKKERKAKNVAKFKKKSKLAVESAAETLLACGLCKIMFDCKELLFKHLDSHKVEGTSYCKTCHETFCSWPQLFGHRMTHLPQKQRHCHMCKYWNMSPNAMEFHYKKLHYDGEDKSMKCKQCSRSFLNPRKLSRHINNVHRQKIFKYVCDYCSKRYHTKQRLRIHIVSHLDAKPYVCDLCGFSTKFKSNLKSHKLRKHDPRSVTCKKCSMVFIDGDKFDTHYAACNPTGVVCPECGKEFLSQKLLTRHLKSHSTEPAYKCPRCPAAYRTHGALKVHLDKHDGNRTQRCEYCGACFYSYTVLLKHRRVHTGEKPYVCKICHRGFTGNHNLKVHMRIHGEDLIVKKNKTPQEPSPFLL